MIIKKNTYNALRLLDLLTIFMKIKEVKFIRSVTDKNAFDYMYEKEKPEVCFVWRSNVGKSSTLNSIFGSKDLVKTSGKPGHTKLANQFSVNNRFICTDLPGYGFAKLSDSEREKIDNLITSYITEYGRDIRKVVIILDAKVGATDHDLDMFLMLQKLGIPSLVVLNKIDKLKSSEIQKIFKSTKEAILGHELITYSTKEQKNKRDFVNAIFDDIEA